MKPKREEFLSSTASFSPAKVPLPSPRQPSRAAARSKEVADKKSAPKRRSHRVSNPDNAEGGDDAGGDDAEDGDDGGDDDGVGNHADFKRSIKLLDYDDLRTRGIRMSRVQLWRLIRAGKFPRQIKVGTKNAWVEREIDAWIESLIAARDFEAA